jgi:hypothetical protein
VSGIGQHPQFNGREAREPHRLRDWVRSGEDEVCRVLRLGCGLDEKFAIVAKFLEPSGNVGGLIRDDCVRDSGFGTKVSASHLHDQFLFRVLRRAEG